MSATRIVRRNKWRQSWYETWRSYCREVERWGYRRRGFFRY